MASVDTVLSLFPKAPPVRGERPGLQPASPGRSHGSASDKVPFRPLGCQFGCPFCYARTTLRYLEQIDLSTFATRIYVKFQAAKVLAETLKPPLLRGCPIS